MKNQEIFSDIESLKNWVCWYYFKTELGWTNEKIAYEMNVNERRLIEWVNKRGAVMNDLQTKRSIEADKIIENLEKKYPIETPKETKVPKIDFDKVEKLFNKGLSLQEIAKKIKCPFSKFKLWWQKNVHQIESRMKESNF